MNLVTKTLLSSKKEALSLEQIKTTEKSDYGKGNNNFVKKVIR